MRQEFEHIELIEKYLLGQLRGKELEDFELRLLNDEKLKEEVELQKMLVSGVENAGLKQSLNFIHQTMFETSASYFSRNWINILAGGSFSLMILVAALFAVFKDHGSISAKTEIHSVPIEKELNSTLENSEGIYFEDSNSYASPGLYTIPDPQDRMNIKIPRAEIKSFFYSLNPNKDTVLTGKGGTVISIPKHCFVFSDGSELSSIYSFELKEAFKRSDLILNDFEGKLLNEPYGTSGAVFLNATKDEKPLQFGTGKNINIKFPYSGDPKEYDKNKTKLDNSVYYKVFNDEPEKRLINVPVDVLDYELNYISDVDEDGNYTSSYAAKHMNEKIEGLTDEKFVNTFVSTLQFHYRIEGCLIYGQNEELLEIYLKNTHLKLWEADSLVAVYLKSKALADCNHYGRYMKAEEYFRWLKSSRYGKVVNIPQLENRNYHKGQIYNKLPNSREIKRLQKWGLSSEEAVLMLNFFKKILYYKSKFKEAKRKNVSLDYYYSQQGRYAEFEMVPCGQSEKQAMKLIQSLPANKLGWVNYEKVPDDSSMSTFGVTVKGLDSTAYRKLYLVINKINYISLGSSINKMNYTFQSIPSNYPAYLVGLAYDNNKIYYGIREVMTGKNANAVLELQPAEEKDIINDLYEFDKRIY
jgi:hypothetical protein